MAMENEGNLALNFFKFRTYDFSKLILQVVYGCEYRTSMIDIQSEKGKKKKEEERSRIRFRWFGNVLIGRLYGSIKVINLVNRVPALSMFYCD